MKVVTSSLPDNRSQAILPVNIEINLVQPPQLNLWSTSDRRLEPSMVIICNVSLNIVSHIFYLSPLSVLRCRHALVIKHVRISLLNHGWFD